MFALTEYPGTLGPFPAWNTLGMEGAGTFYFFCAAVSDSYSLSFSEFKNGTSGLLI